MRQQRVMERRTIFDLVRDFMKDEAFNQQDRTLRRYLNPQLLILDDFGPKQLPKNAGELNGSPSRSARFILLLTSVENARFSPRIGHCENADTPDGRGTGEGWIFAF